MYPTLRNNRTVLIIAYYDQKRVVLRIGRKVHLRQTFFRLLEHE